jgi:predicted nucleic acid-binding protein
MTSPAATRPPPRIIPDLNVFLNGIAAGHPETLNARLYQSFRRGLVRFVICETWLEEFERVLTYPAVLALGITPSLVAKTSRELLLLGEYIAPVPRYDWPDLGDRKDWYLLDLLYESMADGLISQDTQVIAAGTLLGMPVYPPGELVGRGFLEPR